MTRNQVDIVIPTHQKDFEYVESVIEAASMNVLGLRRIFVVSANEYRPRSPQAVWVPEGDITTLPSVAEIDARWPSGEPTSGSRSGWIYQQLLKLGASGYIRELLSTYLCLDADTFFLRPTEFLFPNARFVYPPSPYRQNAPYLEAYRRLVGEEPLQASFVAHHMLYDRELLSGLLRHIEERHGQPWTHAWLDCVDYSQSSPISEQDVYANWVLAHHPELVHCRPLSWADISYIPSARKQRRLSRKYDFVSAHAYLRRAFALRSLDLSRIKHGLARATRDLPGLRPIVRRVRARRAAWAWNRDGKPPPPPPVLKQDLVRRFGRQWNLHHFVETGTFRGDMVAAVCDQFDEVVSVELDPALYRFATERHAGRDNVQLLRGDSAELLPKIIAALDEPALFWLDAHYSEGITARSGVDTPIETELRTILATDQPDHVVLIDDAREFVGANDYPTLAEVERFVSEVRPGWICQVADDVIRIHPPRS